MEDSVILQAEVCRAPLGDIPQALLEFSWIIFENSEVLIMICWQTQRESLYFCHDWQETMKYLLLLCRGKVAGQGLAATLGLSAF